MEVPLLRRDSAGMKNFGAPVSSLALVLGGCVTSYRMPMVSTNFGVTLTRGDVDIVESATGQGVAMMIFPFWLFGGTASSAESAALAKATTSAYEKDGADFLLQPRVKVTYSTWLLFDYATAEAVGKGVRIK